ncbi:ECF-type sigma factor [Tundrisphaera sp. TA3]|uniref:ECF-type sigma factor n=1 Tax=Tundrisphaera sp. TA3 TaxID=3435775 RepID=UPI003EBA6F86
MDSDPLGSVSLWLGNLKEGDHAAVQPLWEKYFDRLVRLARGKLAGGRGLAADEEDVALSAFDSFCRAASQGRFPILADRDDLWKLLVSLTARKAINLRKHAARGKRGGGRVLDEAALDGGDPGAAGLDAMIGDGPTPEFAAQVAEQCRRLLDLLGDESLRQVAIWKFEGYTNEQIGERLGRSPRTVAYKLEMIRKLWEQESSA